MSGWSSGMSTKDHGVVERLRIFDRDLNLHVPEIEALVSFDESE